MTDRLRLREWQSGQAETVFGLMGSEETMGDARTRVYSLAEAQVWLDKRLAQQREHGMTMWAVERLFDDTFVGACGLFPEPDRLELAYILDHRHWRLGYATEAVTAVVAAVREAGEARTIYATIRPHNLGSIRVAEKVGLNLAEEVTDDRGALWVFTL